MCKADASMHVSLNPEQNFAHFGRTCGPIKSHFHIICAAPPRAQRRADFGVPVSLLTQPIEQPAFKQFDATNPPLLVH